MMGADHAPVTNEVPMYPMRMTTLLVVSVLIFVGPAPTQTNDKDARLKEIDAEIAKLEKQLAALKAERSKLVPLPKAMNISLPDMKVGQVVRFQGGGVLLDVR